jgi:hypothetical protein
LTPAHPVDVIERHAVFPAEQPHHVDDGGLRPFGDADPLALEIAGRPHRAVAAYINPGMPEKARGEDRNGREGVVAARAQRDEFPHGHLRDVPFAEPHEAEEDLLDRVVERGERDPLRLNPAGEEIADVIVVVDGNGERERRHLEACSC